MLAFFFHLLLAAAATLSASELYLRDNLKKAEKGDYLVTLSNRLYTVLIVREREGSRLLLDEISIPESSAKEAVTSWESWLKAGAPLSTSALCHTIETTTGKLLSLYSFNRGCQLETGGIESLFSSLLNLPFIPVPERSRRQVSLSDGRSVPWQPKLYVNGQNVEGVLFTPYQSLWPKDGSDLAGMEILIYLPDASSTYPSYFPTWLKIKGKVVKALVRVVDSGKLSTFSPISN